MGNPRPTGNELFDIFWKEYPPRINGAGVMEKKKKGPALKWFETHKPSEEEVYDMVAWLKRDKECRGISEISGGFYSARADAIVFLNQEGWMDEIGVVVTKTQRREDHRSKAVHVSNAKAAIESFSAVILEWSDDNLRASKAFQSAWKYPEFRKWVKEQRQDRKNPTSDADLPPPDFRIGQKEYQAECDARGKLKLEARQKPFFDRINAVIGHKDGKKPKKVPENECLF